MRLIINKNSMKCPVFKSVKKNTFSKTVNTNNTLSTILEEVRSSIVEQIAVQLYAEIIKESDQIVKYSSTPDINTILFFAKDKVSFAPAIISNLPYIIKTLKTQTSVVVPVLPDTINVVDSVDLDNLNIPKSVRISRYDIFPISYDSIIFESGLEDYPIVDGLYHAFKMNNHILDNITFDTTVSSTSIENNVASLVITYYVELYFSFVNFIP